MSKAPSEASSAPRPGPPSPSEADGEAKVPWHFWLLVVALALYLGWPIEDLIIELVRYGLVYVGNDEYGDVENKIYSAYQHVRFQDD